MRVLRGLPRRPPFPEGSVVAIGNFDGLHLGHQKILHVLVDLAREMRLSSAVLTFSPHPEKVLGRRRIGMIQTLDQRLAGIRAYGVGAVILASFDHAFADLTPADFARRILALDLKVRAVVVGENFRFGKARGGDIRDLRRLGRELGFAVHPVAPAVRSGVVISSSLIRRLLENGRIAAANSYLGRAYEIEGRVIRGSGRGHHLGFPTANIKPANEILPKGVYLTLAKVLGRSYPSLTNIGRRPTFDDGRLQVEAHLLDFEGELYERRISLGFLRKIRGENRYARADDLIRQIRRDAATARAFFRKRAALASPASWNGGD